MNAPDLEAMEREESQAVAERDRAHRARNIINDPLFTGAWDAVAAKLAAEMDALPMSAGIEEIQNLRRCQKLLVKMRAVFEAHMETGKMAEAQIAGIEEKRRRFRLFGRSAA